MVALSAGIAATAIGALVKFSSSTSEAYKLDNLVQEGKSFDIAIQSTMLDYNCLPGWNCPLVTNRQGNGSSVESTSGGLMTSKYWPAIQEVLLKCDTNLVAVTNNYASSARGTNRQGNCVMFGLIARGLVPVSEDILKTIPADKDLTKTSYDDLSKFVYLKGFGSIFSKVSSVGAWYMHNVQSYREFSRLYEGLGLSVKAIDGVIAKNGSRTDMLVVYGPTVSVKEAKKIMAKQEGTDSPIGKTIFFANVMVKHTATADGNSGPQYSCLVANTTAPGGVAFANPNGAGKCTLSMVLENAPQIS